MLTTHNLKVLNPEVQQLPLCGQLQADIPKNVLCSKNIQLRNYVWRDPLQFQSDNVSAAVLSKINAEFKETGKLPSYISRNTELSDQRMHHLYLNMGTKRTGEKVLAVTPAPCDGIFHEIIARGIERPDVRLSKQQIEVKADRVCLHGPMAVVHNGALQVFAMPEIKPQPIYMAEADKKYVVLEFGFYNFNVATGMMGVGLPAITNFGTMLANYVAKVCDAEDELRFAIGIHNVSSRPRHNGLNISGSHSDNHLRKANLQGYLVIEPESEAQAESIFRVLSGPLKISGAEPPHKRIFYTQTLPYAHWMHDIGAEVDEYLTLNPSNDVLDVMFDFASEGRPVIPVAIGFSQLSVPKVVESASIKQPHCWVETLFKCTELKYGKFKPEYLYRRFTDGETTFYWAQG